MRSYPVGPEDAVEALQEFVDNSTYLGIFAVLLLGSLGVPIPEEMPIIAAGVLSHEGIVRWWLALPVCLLGVLSGDMVLYWVGRHWGDARAVAVAEGSVSTACTEDRRHGAARHGTPRRRVSDRGQCERPVLEVRGGGRGRRRTRRPVGVRGGLLLHGSAQSHDGRCAPRRALARSRRPPGASGDAGRRGVAMASSRREGASGQEPAIRRRPERSGRRRIAGSKDERIVDPFYAVVRGIARFWIWFFFERVEVRHPERVPSMGPVLLCINHPNNLIDSLLVGSVLPRKVHYLATAALFRNPLIARFQRGRADWSRARTGENEIGNSDSAEKHEVCAREWHEAERSGQPREGQDHADQDHEACAWRQPGRTAQRRGPRGSDR